MSAEFICVAIVRGSRNFSNILCMKFSHDSLIELPPDGYISRDLSGFFKKTRPVLHTQREKEREKRDCISFKELAQMILKAGKSKIHRPG